MKDDIRTEEVLRTKGSCFILHPSSFITRCGFTLLEVLIALAIFSVIIASLYSTFFMSHKAVDALDDSLLRLQESRTVLDVLKREIESAVYDSNKTYTVFKLDDRDFYGKQASRLVFTSFSPLLPGLAQITYSVEETDGRLSLKKKVISAYAKPAETKSIELMEDIESFTVEARYNDKWIKTWDSGLTKAPLPDEIRISVQINPKKGTENEDSKPWGVLRISDVARPRIGKTI
ncbi:MAG TPA: type II secretion system protein GspJ [Thermodesulfovibrionales bacterium]|jgi:general secretion pathway protein J|nr:type II secretion system protein GspJ [Thermodesulfovibrionales bacterium]